MVSSLERFGQEEKLKTLLHLPINSMEDNVGLA